MQKWCRLPTIFKRRGVLLHAALASIFIALITTLLFAFAAHAAPNVDRAVSFHGRLLTASGAVVPDGYYNMQFKIYQGGSGTAAGNPDGTLQWTEAYINDGGTSGVLVKNGYFSVELGSKNSFGTSVDWDNDTLWLSMNVAGDAQGCTTFGTSPCAADGEMLPMQAVTATPYALNSGSVGGKTADELVQLGQGAQTDASTGSSIFINKTGSGNLIQLQNSGNDAFTVASSGSLTLGSDSDKSISIAQAGSDTDGSGLTLAGGDGGSGTGSSGGGLVLQGGDAGGTNGDGGNIVLSGGSGTGTGADGLVILSTPTFSTMTNDDNCYIGGSLVANSCTISQSSVDGSSAIIVGFNTADKTATLPNPTITTAGRIIYIIAASGSSDFTLDIGDATVAMQANTATAVLWSGTKWVSVAGSGSSGSGTGSSSTLQSTYNSPEPAIMTLNSTNGGVRIRDSSTSIDDTLFAVQNNDGSSSYLEVQSDGTVQASNKILTPALDAILASPGAITRANLLASNDTFSGASTYLIPDTFTPQANTVLVAYVHLGEDCSTGTMTVNDLTISGGSLTWVPIGGGLSNIGGCGLVQRAFYALVDGNPPQNMQITVDGNGHDFYNPRAVVDGYTNVDRSNPVAGATFASRASSVNETFSIDLGTSPVAGDWKIGTSTIQNASAPTSYDTPSGWTQLYQLGYGHDTQGIYQTGTTSSTVNFDLSDHLNGYGWTVYGGFILKHATDAMAPLAIGGSNATSITIGKSGTAVSFPGVTFQADGDIALDAGNSLTFEGATDDGFETAFAFADPTADRTITFPDATGTVCLDSGNCSNVYFKDGGNSFGGLATLGTTDNNGLAFITNDSEALRIDAGGQVGIGTTNPQHALDVVGDINVTGQYLVNGADVAENYTSNQQLEPGEIVSFASGTDVQRATTTSRHKLAGIVSTDPGMTLGQGTGNVPLALAGRVPTKVSAENGAIESGDMITASSVAGVGMKATESGRVVGMALEGYSGNGVGEITVFVNPHAWSSPMTLEDIEGAVTLQNTENTSPEPSSDTEQIPDDNNSGNQANDSTSSSPTTTESDSLAGSMYYDATLGEVQCYRANGWGDCIDAPDTFITISPEYTNAVMNGTDIGTITSDLCSDTLNINDGSNGQPAVCGSSETHNFYQWTSHETTNQTRGIYLTYQLPSNFKKFVPGQTSLMGRTDSNGAKVTYQIYRDSDTDLASCGSAIPVSTGPQTTWQKAIGSGNADPANCNFKAGDSILFRINLTAKNDANAYISNLNFVFSNN